MVLALLGALLAGTVSAQIYIPPVFGKDSLDTRSDELSRLYIPPKRIMWVSHDSLVQNKEVLLLSGNGQPEPGEKEYVFHVHLWAGYSLHSAGLRA